MASGTALGTGAPPAEVTCSVRAPPAEEHRPENAPRYSTYVVLGVGTVTPTSLLPTPIVVFSENGRLGRTVVRLGAAAPERGRVGAQHLQVVAAALAEGLVEASTGAPEDRVGAAGSG